MPLNDVWRTIGNDVGYFYESNFDQVPHGPGIYGWFYPLRILSRTEEALENFVAQVQAVLNYDSFTKGPPTSADVLPVVWWSWSVEVARKPKPLQLSVALTQAWQQIAASDELFADFQKALLKASILMPPLYVGKADDLNTRCGQHVRGLLGTNDFHGRYEEFARKLEIPLRSVRQLVFACVRTASSTESGAKESDAPIHELCEGIMKSVCAPPYGRR